MAFERLPTGRTAGIRAYPFAVFFFMAALASCSTATEAVTPEATIPPTVQTPAPSAEESVVYDFEDGTAQGWVPRGGSVSLSVEPGMAHSGSRSLLTANRTENWHGAMVDVTDILKPDCTYEIGGFVRLAAGEPAGQVILSVQRTPAGGRAVDERIVSSPEDGVTDGGWVEVKGEYSFYGEVSELLLYFVSPDSELVDFRIDDVVLTRLATPPVQTDIPSLQEVFAGDFLIGAALSSDQLDSRSHVALLTRHFNILTLPNELKPGPIHPAEGEFRWDGPDKAVRFARENNLAVHGHTLVWHQQTAEWMFEDGDGRPLEKTPENKALVLKRLEDHIHAVAGRYKDDVLIWDVVNEVIDPDQPDCMRRSTWYELTGTEYIATAFRAAREAAPEAVLIINEVNTTDPAKRECLYKVVGDLKAEGVPVDGVGHQMHINIEYPAVDAIEETILRFADLGVEQHITELDISVYANNTDSYEEVPEEILVKQGYRYKDVFDVFRRQTEHISSVMFWGMADDQTWLKTHPIPRLNLPLLFDEHLQAKQAYWGVVDPSKLPPLIRQRDVSKGTPVIDGEAEDLWSGNSWEELPAAGSLAAAFAVLWDEKSLYLFVDVKDATPNPADTVDIFLDPNNGKTGAFETDDRHIACRGGACTPSEGVTAVMQAAPDGYRLEAAIALDSASALHRQFGFDLRVTDSARPDAPISWSDSTHRQETGTAAYGTLTFVEPVALVIALPGIPVIDGIEDAVWNEANEISTDVWVLGDSGATAKVKTLWNDRQLYIYAVVTDALLSKAAADPWEQDSIEVYLDPNNAKTGSYQRDDAQYRVNFDNEQSFNGAAKAELIRSATRIIPGGYLVELAITLDSTAPAEGVRIGFDFQVNNDEDGDGVRDSIAKWHDPTNESYQNTSGFGVLEFGKPR